MTKNINDTKQIAARPQTESPDANVPQKRTGRLDVKELKSRCPMPMLLKKLGLGRYAKESCPSPFRADTHPSWGIFQKGQHWFFKDFRTWESGDEVALLAKVKKLDRKKSFLELLRRYAELADAGHDNEETAVVPAISLDPIIQKPDRSGFGPGDNRQIDALAELRGFSRDALLCAQATGMLVFGRFAGWEVYGITDGSGNAVEVRRLDGVEFPAYKELSPRKSHALKHSRKNWPVGVLESANKPAIALVEGLPDFLALFDFLFSESAFQRVGPVAMLSASTLIGSDALPRFANKHVRLYPHVDAAGLKAAQRWQEQLVAVGARVDFFDISRFKAADKTINDLCDVSQLWKALNNNQPRILP